jgi:hypothetical protein
MEQRRDKAEVKKKSVARGWQNQKVNNAAFRAQ